MTVCSETIHPTNIINVNDSKLNLAGFDTKAEVAIARRTDLRWSPKVLEWRSHTGKRSVATPPARWTDNIRRLAGSSWTQAARDRGFWNSLQKNYVQLWTSDGWHIDDGFD
ncbi:jg11139 [Pararge aegeria aegeria]|uniref:Jg11139 protein n=1 Tax=Pararge aegeria aegeria TaxID=348720 RepID=A0A8S4RIC0_9NEOP|nr:jg11139 [Pararge aegeria aegeria]